VRHLSLLLARHSVQSFVSGVFHCVHSQENFVIADLMVNVQSSVVRIFGKLCHLAKHLAHFFESSRTDDFYWMKNLNQKGMPPPMGSQPIRIRYFC